ncbi:glucuronate isomerase [Amphibacillus sp. Q70]|uniref:glucuronate isomerase n=1 Tax=Amphibacillus sp. Q70 TaxID=3453416 RepID=UPI003F85927A
METFITDDFLLYNDTAKELFHNTAKDLPIIDYHNHLLQDEILHDKTYHNIAEIWLGGDHYKWRAMRANGVNEQYITGNKSDYEKFIAWSKTVPKTLGNPLYHWTHLELLRYFDIDVLLDEKSALAIWEETNKKLATPAFSVRSLLKNQKVEFVGTTDDPTDDLNSHIALAEEGFYSYVSPSFRPDKGLYIEREDFLPWINKLAEVTSSDIETYDQFLAAFEKRVDYFDERGCRSSDHGIDVMFYQPATQAEVADIFQKRLMGKALSSEEIEKFKTYTLIVLGEMYADKGWVMQLHLGALRNNNQKMLRKLGPDTGFDSIGDVLIADKLAGFLDSLEKVGKLPKTILYSLNARDYNVLATMAGNYQGSEIPGKLQLGTAWWFNDTIDGMEKQMKTLANMGLISHFVGMLTDSRSFLSFPRHEYFRRVLCNLLGSWVEEHKIPKDMTLLKQYARHICYQNAKNYFSL